VDIIQGAYEESLLPDVPSESKEKRVPRIRQGMMSIPQYASKFIELPCFALAYLENETLKMNWFRSGLNHKLKIAMSVGIDSSYPEMYDTAINVEQS